MTFSVPQIDGPELGIIIEAGKTVYVLGPNGSGKSTLLFRWTREHRGSVLIAGNRDVNFLGAGVSVSAAEALRQTEIQHNHMNEIRSRHRRGPHSDQSRLSRLLFRLKSHGEHSNDLYRRAHLRGDVAELQRISATIPLDQINEALRIASLKLRLQWTAESELKVQRQGVERDYGVDEMSDGERSALIIATEVILSERGATILIDEPERHLHRAISAPLLGFLRTLRPDLAWIISTHDLTLPGDDLDARTLILYSYDGERWEADLPPESGTLRPRLATAIHGARRRVLFVEGDASSRDKSIFQIFFPDVTIVPVGTRRGVEQAVKGLGEIDALHHMQAAGIVDRDNRDDAERLQERRIVPLGVYAIESIYYHSAVIAALLVHAGTTNRFDEIIDTAIGAIKPDRIDHAGRDAAYKAFKAMWEKSCASMNAFDSDESAAPMTASQASKLVATSRGTLSELIDARNWEGIVAGFKIKSTPAPGKIASAMGFGGMASYEEAARKRLRADEALRRQLAELIPDPFG